MLCSRLLFTFALLVTAACASPENDVRAADTARVTATIAGDFRGLAPLLSDELSYGHSDGRVQTKLDFLDTVRTSRVKYEAYDYEELHAQNVGEGLVTLTGRVFLRASAGGETITARLRFLAVWRQENGAWRLFAYQSTRQPEAVAP